METNTRKPTYDELAALVLELRAHIAEQDKRIGAKLTFFIHGTDTIDEEGWRMLNEIVARGHCLGSSCKFREFERFCGDFSENSRLDVLRECRAIRWGGAGTKALARAQRPEHFCPGLNFVESWCSRLIVVERT